MLAWVSCKTCWHIIGELWEEGRAKSQDKVRACIICCGSEVIDGSLIMIKHNIYDRKKRIH